MDPGVPFKKRLLDVVVASVGIVVALPVLVLVALAIWLEDGGPVLFRQKRVGRLGRIFQIYKFRKFINRNCGAGPKVTLTNDHRYSRVGKVLDKTKLNELPQLFNVLRGDMSIVGPRPEIPEFRHCYVGPYEKLLKITPGIFGPSQTTFRNEADLYPTDQDADAFYQRYLFPAKAGLDLSYYEQAGNMSDVCWIVRSVAAVVAGGREPQQDQSLIPGKENGEFPAT